MSKLDGQGFYTKQQKKK